MTSLKQNKIHRLFKALIPWVAFLALLFLTVKAAHAQSYLGGEWDRYLQGVKTFVPTGQTGEALATNFVLNLVRIVRNLVGAVALVLGVLYGFKLVISRGQEDTITKQKSNFLYALLGFMILIISENIARIFNPETATSGQLVDFNASRDQLRDIANYMKWLLGSVAVLMFAISAVRLITAQGEEEVLTKQKKNIVWSFIGMLTILLASNIVNAVYVIRSPDETAAAGPQSAINEIGGIIRLALVFLGPAAIAFTIYAGYMYLTALDNEEQVNKAKRMIVAGIVASVIIYGAYAIVNTLVSADLALINAYLA